MYCINCGVKLADTEKKCPLCETVVYHPEIIRGEAEPLFPKGHYPEPYTGSRAAQIVLTAFSLMTACICLLCDHQVNAGVTWSGYVVGALIVVYTAFVLPYWFRKPNITAAVPSVFVVIALYLLYINQKTNGDWFISFALPVTGGVGVITTIAAFLLKYLHRGKLFVFGGLLISLGVFILLLEFLLSITFSAIAFWGWSLYPLIVLTVLGGMVIALAMYSPAREVVKRKTFI